MKLSVVLLVVGCWLSTVSAQWLETVVSLPESSYTVAMCYNTQNNRIYAASWYGSKVTVIDGATNAVLTTIPTGDTSGLCAICYNPQNNKIYCANRFANNVTVIDGATNAVITQVPAGNEPVSLCCNSQDNKVYCANGGWFMTGPDSMGTDSTVTVIDGATNGVVATIVTPGHPHGLCYNPQDNKVYCANNSRERHTVTVIDGTSNGVITTVDAGEWPGAVCYSPVNNRVYCAVSSSGSGSNVFVLDGTTNAVVAMPEVGGTPIALCSNSQDNKVYCANNADNDVSVIDGVSNAVVATPATDVGPFALCYSPENSKVYCANAGPWSGWQDSTVTVIDGPTNTVIKTIRVGISPVAMAYNSVQNRIYVGNYHSSSVSVIRDSTSGIEESRRPMVPGRPFTAAVVRGAIILPQAEGRKPQVPVCLLDISGRSVLKLHPGANDVSRLAPGVYFVQELQARNQAQAVRKIMLVR